MEGAIRSRIEFRTCLCEPHEFFPRFLPLSITPTILEGKKKNEREGVEKERREEEEIGSIEVGETKRDMDPS